MTKINMLKYLWAGEKRLISMQNNLQWCLLLCNLCSIQSLKEQGM